MRLICPNCKAQYEVGDSVIPDAGRDVQCSSCGKTWFQRAAGAPDPEPVPMGVTQPPVPHGAFAEAHAFAPIAETLRQGAPTDPNGAGLARAGVARAMTRSSNIARGHAADTPPTRLRISKPEANAPQGAPTGDSVQEDDRIADDIVAMLEAEDQDEPMTHSATHSPADLSGPAPESEAGIDTEAAPSTEPPRRPRKRIDDSMLAILREEAEREAAARRAEGSLLETQQEMNLEPAASAASRVKAKLAAAQAMAGLDGGPEAPETSPTAQLTPQPTVVQMPPEPEALADVPPPAAAPSQSSSAAPSMRPEPPRRAAELTARERLPDIEEINSTLTASADRSHQAAAIDAPQVRAQQRSGFRLGFTLVIGLAVVLVGLYAGASRMSAAVPPLAAPLSAYSDGIDGLRHALDAQLQRVIAALQDDSAS